MNANEYANFLNINFNKAGMIGLYAIVEGDKVFVLSTAGAGATLIFGKDEGQWKAGYYRPR